MKVRTLKSHGNCFGDQYDKAVGEVYEHPSPKADLTLGNVENADDNKADGNAGTGAKASSSKGRNSQKQNAKGSKAGGGAGRKKS